MSDIMNEISINPEGMTPFFQVHSEKRVRFSWDKLGKNIVTDLIHTIFGEMQITMTVLIGCSYELNFVKEKTGIGKFFTITNWKETLIDSEDREFQFVMAQIERIKMDEIINYCMKIKNGHPQAYITFNDETSLLYVSTDVMDIVSQDRSLITDLKKQYHGFVDVYWEA
ncbi:phosphatase [Macrococcus bovicus]|uniref:Phosphatase n=1 Tax=Macrococcus bovicus TaxID=69968 RepID=A0A4R6C2Z1_9STAP|nr:phosphatase [Macrococcus bovicus]TDM15747.1 phosphatase [Macrococcus bovicus]